MENSLTLFSVLGWEERFVLGTYQILENYKISNVYLVCFADYSQMKNMKENKQKIIDILITKGIELTILELNYDNSISNWHKLDDFFKTSIFKNVLLNITTFPRETIWMFLYFLRLHEVGVRYIYYKPLSYDNSEGGLTKNHKSPRLLFKHSGVFDINKKLVIFLITGFDTQRMDLIIEHYEPDKVVYLSQEGEQFENMKRNSGIFPKTAYKNIIEENLAINCYEINQLHEELKKLTDSHKEYNIIISSQGPKTSAISTYLVYLDNNNLALSYVPAREFSGDYSSGFNNLPIAGEIEY